jgi:polyisoprenoid-binding protein YceI
MFKRMLLAMVASVAVSATGWAQDATYKADKAHAYVGFEVSHMVISKVKGSFQEFDATLQLDSEGKLGAVNATIDVASIDTGVKKRDDHLRNADFFDAEKYPKISFTSAGPRERDGKSWLVGDLTLRGVTKEVALEYEVKGPINDPWGSKKLGVQLTGQIDRTEYGLTWSKTMETGGLIVGHEVDLVIDVEFALEQ